MVTAEEKQVLTRANAEIERSGRTHADLAATVRVPVASLEAALSGRRAFTVGEVVMLARALGQRAAEWFEPKSEPILIEAGKLVSLVASLATSRGAR